VIPVGNRVDAAPVDPLKYQPNEKAPDSRDDAANAMISAAASNELLTLKMRYKAPEGDVSQKLEWPVIDDERDFSAASSDFRFAAGVAEFGLLLRGSQYRGDASFNSVAEIGVNSLGEDAHSYRTEFIELVRRAGELSSSR
jgi:Ca-activated chloride channel homolog